MPSVTSRATVWFQLAGGGLAWFAHLLISYAIGEFGCVSGFWTQPFAGVMGISWLLLAATVAMLVVAAAAVWVSWRNSRTFRPAASVERPEAAVESRYFMARIGLLTNTIFLLIIAVEAVPIFYYLRDCGSWMR